MKKRLLHGYLYYHTETRTVHVWDTYGQKSFPSVTGGTWKLIGPAPESKKT
jgi:hypothetical protein